MLNLRHAAAAAPMTTADAEIAAAIDFAMQEKAESTRRAYASDWRVFRAWCTARGLNPMPADAATVARFLSSEATGGLKTSTIGRRAAAIGDSVSLESRPPVRAVSRGKY